MGEEEESESEDKRVDNGDLSEFSYSVRTAIRGVKEKEISSWLIVQRLAELHPEYGGNMARTLSKERGPAQVTLRPVSEWLAEVRRVITPTRRYVLDGRLTILALAKVDHALADFLSKTRFLDAVKDELKEPYEHFFPSESGTPRLLPDPTPLQMDTPATADQLGRKAFGRTLAIRLGRIWNENRATNADASFMLHLHGPWGAGKTTLLNLLRNELQPHPRPAAASSRWVVIDFNAWQNQRINPPWWPLLDTVYRQALEQLSNYYLERRRGWALRLRELWWRFITVNREHVLLSLIAFLLVGALSVMAWYYWPQFVAALTPTETQAAGKATGALDLSGKAISGLLALAGAIIALSSFASRSLLSGSARAAQSFVQSAVDPMARIAEHFRKLVTWVAHPIIIFIDDLDRCPSEYVVNLLEGIQTLFKDSRVLYVISADRRWLYTCYEKVYEPFGASIREPGRSLGCLFLEKAVQLSVSLPQLTPQLQGVFWDYLARGESGDANQLLEQAAKQARSDFEGAVTQDDIASKLKSGSKQDDPIQVHVRREEAVLRLATERIEESTAYFLKAFAPLLEPNPRAMKRLLNAYALQRDMAILGGLNVLDDLEERKRLVLWTIVCLRWPLLEELLIENVLYVDAIHSGQPPVAVSKTMRQLFTNESVKQVFGGVGLKVKLDKEAIIRFAGLRASSSGPATVD